MKKLLLIVTCFLTFFGMAQAATGTLTFSDYFLANSTALTNLPVGSSGVTVSIEKGTGTTAPQYYTNGEALRAYGGNTITLSYSSDTEVIKEIVFTYGSGGNDNALTANTGSFKDDTWTGASNEVVFTLGGTSGNRRIASITVTTGEGTGTLPPVDPDPDDPEPGLETDVTYVPSAQGYTNAQAITSYSSDDVTFSFSKGSGSTAPAYYTTGAALRLYGGNTMTISVPDGYTILEVTMAFASGEGTNTISVNEGTLDGNTWTGKTDNVVFTIDGSSGHRRVSSVKVVYSAPSGELKPSGLSFSQTEATAKLGASFTAPELSKDTNAAITFTSSNENVATVGNDGALNILALGKTTITATAAQNDEYASGKASYTLSVVPAEDFYTPSQALQAIMNGYDSQAVVKGYITDITEVSVQYGNATYTINDTAEGDPEEGLLVYRGKWLNGADFTDEGQIQKGGYVTVSGDLVNFNNTTPEVATGSQITDYVAPQTEPAQTSTVNFVVDGNPSGLTVTNSDGQKLDVAQNFSYTYEGDAVLTFSIPTENDEYANMYLEFDWDKYGETGAITPVDIPEEEWKDGIYELRYRFTPDANGAAVTIYLEGEGPGFKPDEMSVIFKLDAPAGFNPAANLEFYNGSSDENLMRDGGFDEEGILSLINVPVTADNYQLKFDLRALNGYIVEFEVPAGLSPDDYEMGTEPYIPDSESEETGEEFQYLIVKEGASGSTFTIKVTAPAVGIISVTPENGTTIVLGDTYEGIQDVTFNVLYDQKVKLIEVGNLNQRSVVTGDVPFDIDPKPGEGYFASYNFTVPAEYLQKLAENRQPNEENFGIGFSIQAVSELGSKIETSLFYPISQEDGEIPPLPTTYPEVLYFAQPLANAGQNVENPQTLEMTEPGIYEGTIKIDKGMSYFGFYTDVNGEITKYGHNGFAPIGAVTVFPGEDPELIEDAQIVENPASNFSWYITAYPTDCKGFYDVTVNLEDLTLSLVAVTEAMPPTSLYLWGNINGYESTGRNTNMATFERVEGTDTYTLKGFEVPACGVFTPDGEYSPVDGAPNDGFYFFLNDNAVTQTNSQAYGDPTIYEAPLDDFLISLKGNGTSKTIDGIVSGRTGMSFIATTPGIYNFTYNWTAEGGNFVAELVEQYPEVTIEFTGVDGAYNFVDVVNLDNEPVSFKRAQNLISYKTSAGLNFHAKEGYVIEVTGPANAPEGSYSIEGQSYGNEQATVLGLYEAANGLTFTVNVSEIPEYPEAIYVACEANGFDPQQNPEGWVLNRGEAEDGEELLYTGYVTIPEGELKMYLVAGNQYFVPVENTTVFAEGNVFTGNYTIAENSTAYWMNENWTGGEIGIQVNMETGTVMFQAEVETPDIWQLRGPFNDFNPAGNAEWAIKASENEEENGVYTGTFNIPVGQFSFNLLSPWGQVFVPFKGYDPVDEEMTFNAEGVFIGTTDYAYDETEEAYVWSYPAWEGGEATISINVNEGVVTVTIPVKEEEPVDFFDFVADPDPAVTPIIDGDFYGVTLTWDYPVEIVTTEPTFDDEGYIESQPFSINWANVADETLIVEAEGNKLTMWLVNPIKQNPMWSEFVNASITRGAIKVNGQLFEGEEDIVLSYELLQGGSSIQIPDVTSDPARGTEPQVRTIDEITLSWDGFYVGWSDNYNNWTDVQKNAKVYVTDKGTFYTPGDIATAIGVTLEGVDFMPYTTRFAKNLVVKPAQTLNDPSKWYTLVIPSGSLAFKDYDNIEMIDVYDEEISLIYTVTGEGGTLFSPVNYQEVDYKDWKGLQVSGNNIVLNNAGAIKLFEGWGLNNTQLNGEPLAYGVDANANEGISLAAVNDINVIFPDAEPLYNGLYTIYIPAGAITGVGATKIEFQISGNMPSGETLIWSANPENNTTVEEISSVKVWWGDGYRLVNPKDIPGDEENEIPGETYPIVGQMTVGENAPVDVNFNIVSELVAGDNDDNDGVNYAYSLVYTPETPIVEAGTYLFTIPGDVIQIQKNQQVQVMNPLIELSYTVVPATVNSVVFEDFTMVLKENSTEPVTKEVPVSIELEEGYTMPAWMGIQFDVVLPEGLEVSAAAFNAPLSGRVDAGPYTPRADEIDQYPAGATNIYRVLGTMATSTNLTDEILNFTVSTVEDKEIEEGIYDVIITNTVVLSTPGGSEINDFLGSTGTVTIEYLSVPAESVEITNVEVAEPSISDDPENVTVGESLDVTVVVEPENATVEFEWSVQPDDLGITIKENADGTWTVDTSGANVTEETEITITVTVGEDENGDPIQDSFTFTLKPVLLGDSNNNGRVNVADVVTTANYIAELDVVEFCWPNANVILNDTETAGGRNGITVADVTATVDIALHDWDGEREPQNVRRYTSRSMNNDRLVADNFKARQNKAFNVGVNLDNTVAYSAISATVNVPEGMTVHEVTVGPRAAGHELVYNITEDGKVNVVLYSVTNAAFGETEGSLFNLVVTAKEDCGNMTIGRISASDASSNIYDLNYEGGLNESVATGVDGLDTDEAGDVRYYDINGVEVVNPEAGQILIRVANGNAEKVVIK